MPSKPGVPAHYGQGLSEVPCWDSECPGTITMHPDPRRCACSVCGKRPPNVDMVTKSVVLFLVLIGLVLACFLAMVVWGVSVWMQTH